MERSLRQPEMGHKIRLKVDMRGLPAKATFQTKNSTLLP